MNAGIADARRGELLGRPAFLHRLRKLREIPAQEAFLHHPRLVLEPVQRIERVGITTVHPLLLLGDDARRLARYARIEQYRGRLQLEQNPWLDAERSDEHLSACAELHEVDAAERGGIVILPAARQP